MKPLFFIPLCFALACGGLQSTQADCEDGFERADDGGCYPTVPNDVGIDNNEDGGNDDEFDFDGAPPIDTGNPGGGANGGGDMGGAAGGGDMGGAAGGGGATGGGGAVGGGDMGGAAGGGGAVGGGDMGGAAGGGGAVGGGDMGGAAGGGGAVGGGDIGGGAGGGDIGGEAGGAEAGGEDFEPTSCTTDADCSADDCPPGGTGCACLPALGECMPTCSSDDDCESGTICFEGFCEPPLEDPS